MLGVGFTIPEISIRAGTSSGAALLLKTESDGLALDFTDNYFAGSGFYGSARIKDTTTPANAYNAAPTLEGSSLLSYSSPSVKLTRKSDGVFRYQAHNLYLNSAAPANQSITVVSGATYAITITGSVSTTLSGAATGTITAGTTNITASTTTLTFGSTSGSGTVHVRRTPSDATYLATAGSARFGLPMEWDVSGNPLGLLVEEARTNLVLRSTNFSLSWARDGVLAFGSGSTTNESAPDGTSTACKVVESTANATHGISQQLAKSAVSTTYANSVFAKAAGRTDFQIQSFDGSGGCFARVNLSTGAVIASPSTYGTGWTAGAVTVQNVGNGYWRVSLVATTSAGSTVDAYYAMRDAAGTQVYAGDGSSGIILWGAQLEAGSFATSPIETFGSTVTRAADNISLATSGFLFAIPFTMYASWERVSPTTLVYNRRVSVFGTNPEAAFVQYNGILYNSNFNNTPANDISQNIGTETGVVKVASSYENNNTQACVNGGSVLLDTSCSIGPTMTTVGFGRGQASATESAMYLRKFLLLSRRMTATELQNLTK